MASSDSGADEPCGADQDGCVYAQGGVHGAGEPAYAYEREKQDIQ